MRSGILGTPTVRIFGTHYNEALGSVTAGIGDVNGDGFVDLATTSNNNAGGSVLVYLGTATALNTTSARTLSAETATAGFGRSIARSSP